MRSNELKIEAGKEDNDLRAFALYAKANRQKRIEDFEEYYIQHLMLHPAFTVYYYDGYSCSFQIKGENYTYWIGKDKLHQHKNNKYFEHGLTKIQMLFKIKFVQPKEMERRKLILEEE